MDWFTSDQHFGHVNILNYTDRPYADLDEMAEALVENANAVISPTDTVYMVGDVVMGKRDVNLEYLRRVNGKKILIMGNHDHCHPMHKQKIVDKWTPVYAQYFDQMVQSMVYTAPDGRKININHFPYEGDHVEDRYNAEQIDAFRTPDDGNWLLHGHIHSPLFVSGRHQIHVGVDSEVAQYGPISIDTIIDTIEQHESCSECTSTA